MTMVVLSALGCTQAEGIAVMCIRCATRTSPAALTVAASAVVVAAVVVEHDPEARTGSRRSMMTDDSRPNRQLTTRGPLQQVAQVFLYGKVKTPSK